MEQAPFVKPEAHEVDPSWRVNMPNDELIPILENITKFIRRDSFEVIRTANSGHVGGSSSNTEMLVAMYFGGRFNFDLMNPKNPNRDQILIRGHEGPLRYSIFSLLGFIEREELNQYRRFNSRLHGHEDMHATPGVDITPSGSLGMLLSYGVGAASVNKNENHQGRIIVYLGDGEEQEGNVSEAARHATSLNLDNLICIIDKNGKQLTRPTIEVDGGANLKQIWEGYGWNVIEAEDGNNIPQLLDVYDRLQNIVKPTLVISTTIKGKGIRGAEEHYNGFHTLKVTDRGALDEAIDQLSSELAPQDVNKIFSSSRNLVAKASSEAREKPKLTASAYSQRYDGPNPINIQDARDLYFEKVRDKSNSSTSPLYMISPDFILSDIEKKKEYGEFAHFYNVGIREQHAVAMAHGIATQQPEARILLHFWDFCSIRAIDQMNAAAQAGSNIVVNGADAGIYHGNNGRTHMSLGQPGAFLSFPEIEMYEPADADDLFNVYSHAFASRDGFKYVRLHAGEMPKLDRDESDIENISAYKTFVPDGRAQLTIMSSGSFVKNAIEAAKLLEIEFGISTEVVNVINQKDIGKEAEKLFHDELPILTLYNGSPAVLQSSVSNSIMSTPNIERPRIIVGHGIEKGTTGRLKELESYYMLDANGIALIAMKKIFDRK